MKLKEYLKAASIDGDFGIEIEVEGENLPTIRSNNWHTEKDGSLRGESNEYIITKPIKIDEVREAIEYLNKRLDKSVLNFSFRTSVHIHMNMLECTHEEILNTVYTYLLIEEPLIKFCGKERKANRFCLRLQDADGIIDTLSMLLS